MFKPKIDSLVKVYKKNDGTIIRIIPIKGNSTLKNKHISRRFLRISYVYTLILGVLLLTLITEEIHVNQNYYSMIFLIGLSLIILSTLMIILKTRFLEKSYFLLTTLFYIFLIIVGIILMIKGSTISGIMLLLISAIPIMFNLLYFRKLEKPVIPSVKFFMMNLK